MTLLLKLYVLLGRLIWPLQLPLMQRLICYTHRAYVVIIYDHQVLMTKNWLSDGKWALPGGGVGRRETVAEAVVREVDEELGLKLKSAFLKPLSSGKWRSHKLNFNYDLLSYKLERAVSFHPNKFEITTVSWVKLQDLNKDNTAAEILEGLNLI